MKGDTKTTVILEIDGIQVRVGVYELWQLRDQPGAEDVQDDIRETLRDTLSAPRTLDTAADVSEATDAPTDAQGDELQMDATDAMREFLWTLRPVGT